MNSDLRSRAFRDGCGGKPSSAGAIPKAVVLIRRRLLLRETLCFAGFSRQGPKAGGLVLGRRELFAKADAVRQAPYRGLSEEVFGETVDLRDEGRPERQWEMVAGGWSSWFDKYAIRDTALREDEATARKQKVGLWNVSMPVLLGSSGRSDAPTSSTEESEGLEEAGELGRHLPTLKVGTPIKIDDHTDRPTAVTMFRKWIKW